MAIAIDELDLIRSVKDHYGHTLFIDDENLDTYGYTE